MTTISHTKKPLVHWTTGLTVVVLMGLTSGHFYSSVRCQFLQPQSHLGRLVQSITSPLVLSSSAFSGASSSDSDLYGAGESGELSGPESLTDSGVASSGSYYQQPSAASNKQRQQQQQSQEDAAQQQQHYQRGSAWPSKHAHAHAQASSSGSINSGGGLQQAPSQQRGVPQHYYGGGGGGVDDSHDDEDSGATTNRQRSQQQAAADEHYKMGAYLGPTIDDKEIQGAFNSNDDRDEDEAAGYEGPPALSSSGARHRSAASSYVASQPSGFNSAAALDNENGKLPFSPVGGFSSFGAAGGSRATTNGPAQEQANFDGELGADEDDEPSSAGNARGSAQQQQQRRPRFKSSSSLSQAAASHYQQRQARNNNNQQSMVMAANGYSPMGASGPFDLSGLMAGMVNGGGGQQGFEVYNGDGSYGPGQGYYQQQQQRGNGRRQQAASMNNLYGGNPYVQQQQQQRQGENNSVDSDEADSDQDED